MDHFNSLFILSSYLFGRIWEAAPLPPVSVCLNLAEFIAARGSSATSVCLETAVTQNMRSCGQLLSILPFLTARMFVNGKPIYTVPKFLSVLCRWEATPLSPVSIRVCVWAPPGGPHALPHGWEALQVWAVFLPLQRPQQPLAPPPTTTQAAAHEGSALRPLTPQGATHFSYCVTLITFSRHLRHSWAHASIPMFPEHSVKSIVRKVTKLVLVK